VTATTTEYKFSQLKETSSSSLEVKGVVKDSLSGLLELQLFQTEVESLLSLTGATTEFKCLEQKVTFSLSLEAKVLLKVFFRDQKELQLTL